MRFEIGLEKGKEAEGGVAGGERGLGAVRLGVLCCTIEKKRGVAVHCCHWPPLTRYYKVPFAGGNGSIGDLNKLG